MKHRTALLACTLLLACSGPEDGDDDVNNNDDDDDDTEFACPGGWESLVLDPEFRAETTSILGADIDSEIDWHRPSTPFLAARPVEERSRGELFVALPGSGGSPERMQRLLTAAAYAGYHTIGLAYSNGGSVSDTCQGPNAPVCHGEVIHERVYGEDTSDLVEVDPDNSVVGRLALFLDHLDLEWPEMGWGEFAPGGAIDWARVAISGHSQGGKTAAYISRDFETARAVLLSATGSAFQGPDGELFLAPWTLEERATPPSRTYGLWHLGEASNGYAPVILDSYGVGAFGDIEEVDEAPPPFGCSHLLRTEAVPGANNPADSGGCNEHSATVADDCLALDEDGVPIITPAHLYMMTWEETR